MGNPQLFTNACGIHQPFRTAGTFAAHQPKRDPFHVPAGLHEQRGRQGAVHTA